MGSPAPAAGGNPAEWSRLQLHTIAAGARMAYELLSGDLSQVNFSSIRLGLITFRRTIGLLQDQVLIRGFCAPVWRWFIDAAVAAGELPDRAYPVRWSPPRWEEADRLTAAKADLAEARAGLRSMRDLIVAAGDDPDETLAEIADWNAELDAAGVVLDSDPRKSAAAGSSVRPE